MLEDMGSTERRERQKAELREQILAAASRIIADEGFTALTMRKIAEAIEYSPATIYLHFASRDEIALALVHDGFAKLVRHLTPAAAESDPVRRLCAIGHAYLDFAERDPQTYRLIFMEDERFAALAMHALEASEDDTGDIAFGVLLTAVTDVLSLDGYRPLDPHEVASLLWASLHGIAALNLTCGMYPFPNGTAAPGTVLMDMLLRGLRD
jgi:AcrR family transcriptional regulator